MTEVNIYDTANQLERDLRTLPAFKNLVEAFKEIKANQESNNLFEEFKKASQDYQMKQMMGQEPEEAELMALQDMSVKVNEDEAIKKLMESEQQLSQIMADINQIITKPLQEIYQSEAE